MLEYDAAELLDSGCRFVGSLEREAGENVGDYRILQGTLAVEPPNYAIVLGEAQLTVEPRHVTVRGRSQVMEYGDDFPESEYDVVEGSLVEGDQFLVEAAPGVGPCPGTYEISLENVSLNGNYVLTRQPGTLSIRNRQVSLKADDVWKIAGTEDSELTYTVTSGSFAPGLVVYGRLTREAGEAPGVYRITDEELMYPAFHDVTFTEGRLQIVDGEDVNEETKDGADFVEEASIIVSTSGREGTIRTLEEAIARVGNGWTIFVEPGVYECPIWVVEKSVRIEGVPDQDGSLPMLRGCLNFNGAGASSSVMTKVHLESDQGPAVVIGFDCRDTVIFGNEIVGKYIGVLSDNRTPVLSENQIRALFQVIYTDGL